jgi:signal peptidase I
MASERLHATPPSVAVPRTIPRRRSFRWRRLLAILNVAVTIGALGFWFVALRPQSLGGPAQFVMVAGTSMLPTLKTGDVVVVRAQADYHVGDIVAYRIPKGDPAAGGRVIHRIIGGSGTRGYEIQGDNRKSADLWHPRNADVLGKVWIRLPQAARVAVFLRAPLVLASLAAGLIFALVVGGGREEEREET